MRPYLGEPWVALSVSRRIFSGKKSQGLNMKMLFLLSSLLLISGCGDKNKSEFMDGCTGGNTSDYAHQVCSCAYEKMKSEYGPPNKWESKINREGPDGLISAMQKSVESCK